MVGDCVPGNPRSSISSTGQEWASNVFGVLQLSAPLREY